MNGRKVGRLRSLFILVSLGTTSAVVANCGGDDTGTTPGTGGSIGTGGSAGTGGTDAGSTGGARDAGRDSSLGGSAGNAGVDGAPADRPADTPTLPTEAAIAACNATLADSGVTPCLQNCFCNLCPSVGVGCLGNAACLNIARCAIETQCLVAPNIATAIAQCTDSETCGPTIAMNPTGLAPAITLINAPCTPVCLAQCSAADVDASTGPDAQDEIGPNPPDATGGDATTGGEAEVDAQGPAAEGGD